MLSLDATTLHLFNLRAAAGPKAPNVIKDWVAGIRNVPTKSTKSKGLKVGASLSVVSSTVAASTVAASTTRKSRTTSSGGVGVSGTSAPASTIAVNEVGGLFDDDEDEERDAALSSPIKGHKRVTSSVPYCSCHLPHLIFHLEPRRD
jgi:hypothetical protein